MTNYHIDLDSQGNGTIYIYEGNQVHEVRSSSADFTRIFAGLQQGKAWDELDGLTGVREIVNLSDRITLIGDDELRFDGEVVDSSLSDAIKRYHVEGRDMQGLVNFMTKLFDAHDSFTIRNHTFTWLTKQRLEVTPEGNLLGYRGVDSNLRANHKGSGAYVNGVWDDGTYGVDNSVGNVVTLPRHQVDDDPTNACSNGLHVGNEAYARSWGTRHLVIEVEPKNIVSVPVNEAAKMRVCAYKVLEEIIDEVPDYEAEAFGNSHDAIESIEGPKADTWRARLRKLVGRR